MDLSLQAMTEADYRDWWAIIVPEYAADKIASGAWSEVEAVGKSTASMHEQLPQGLATPANHLCTLTLLPAATRVGFLWFTHQGQTAFLYDLYIYPAHRRQGHGRRALHLLEAAAAAQGLNAIGLHVFGHNPAAQELYLQAGFQITDLSMRKALPPPPATGG